MKRNGRICVRFFAGEDFRIVLSIYLRALYVIQQKPLTSVRGFAFSNYLP